MTDQRPLSTGQAPDDPFERELRALLRDRAAGPVPASLAGALQDATRRSAPVRVRLAGHRRPVLTLVAAAAGLLLLGMGLNPVSMFMEATVPGATKPTPRTALEGSPSPQTTAGPVSTADASPDGRSGPDADQSAAFDWGDDRVTFRADGLELSVGGGRDAAHVGDVPFLLAPTRRHLAAGVEELRWDWIDDERTRLTMRVESDGARWWVTEVTYHDALISDDPSTWTTTPMAARMGRAWTGDLRLGRGAASGYAGSVRITGMTFDPGVTPAIVDPPPVATPAPAAPFAIDNGSVRLTADAFEVQSLGDTLRGPVGVGPADPGGTTLQSDTLHAKWFDGDLLIQLTLEFRSDGERWRTTSGELSAWAHGYAKLDATDLEAITAPLGQPFTGDLAITVPQWTAGPPDHHRTGREMVITVRNLSVQPFRAQRARTMTDCMPVVPLEKADRTADPAAKGGPLAGVGLIGMDAADAARIVANLGYCYLFDRRLSVDPSLGISGSNETWCDAPPGTVTALRYGRGGELHLIVVTQVPRGTSKRSQPVFGFGCREGVATPSDPPPVSTLPAPTPPVVMHLTDAPMVWDTGDVRLAADAVVLRVGDRTYRAAPGQHGGDPDMHDDLEVLHLDLDGDDGFAQVRAFFAADGSGWTMQRFEVYGAGVDPDRPVSVAGVGVPRPEPMRGDLVLPGSGVTVDGPVDISLELRGAELQAFRGVTARTLRDCQNPRDLRPGGSDQPLDVGQPLDGLGLRDAPARKAAAAMDRLGYCYRFSLQGSTGNGPGWGEQWCDPPPGRMERAYYGDQGEVVFIVTQAERRPAREQPPVGWGCLSDIPAYAGATP